MVRVTPKVAGVGVTRNMLYFTLHRIALFFALVSLAAQTFAAVLPEDRADLSYHSYDGGGVEVNGPTLLVRKNFAEKVSVYGKYHHDSISGASPDVLAGASPYSESRDEYSFGGDYLHDNTILGLSYTYSEEDDYEANTIGFNVSHELFSAMTTVSLGVSYGWDTVMRVDASAFEADLERFQYRLGLSQVITKTIIANLSYEATVEDGFLSNPYRFVLIGTIPQGLGSEVYPGTRTGQAAAGRISKYWWFEGSTTLGYRYFRDTWGIKAHTVDLVYSQYLWDRWLADFYARYYTQNAADFYSNNFAVAQNFMARDKELSTFDSYSLGANIRYEIFKEYSFLTNGTVNLSLEYIENKYDDYSGIENFAQFTDDGYSFDATVLQFYFSVRY